MSDYLMSLLNNSNSACKVAVGRLMGYSLTAQPAETP